MPPRKRARISAPPDRVYTASTPLAQTRLPAPRKRIRSTTTYGRRATKRIPKQETLTQMWDGDGGVMFGEGGGGEGGSGDEGEGEGEGEEKGGHGDGDHEAVARRPGGKGLKRRNTEGGVLNGSASASGSGKKDWHTQHLTQMHNWSFSSAVDEDGRDEGEQELRQEEGQEEGERRSIWDVPSSSQTGPPSSPVKVSQAKAGVASRASSSGKGKAAGGGKDTQKGRSPSKEMPPPQTPRRKIVALEIPSSQSPAGTPLSLPSKGSVRRSPLKDTSPNIAIPFNVRVGERRSAASPEKLPVLEVRDTFATEDESQVTNRLLSSPVKRLSPAKSVRWALPNDEDEEEELEPRSPSLKRIGTPKLRAKRVARHDKDEDDGGEQSLSLFASQPDPEPPSQYPTKNGGSRGEEPRPLDMSQATGNSPFQYITLEHRGERGEELQQVTAVQTSREPAPRKFLGQRTVVEDSDAESEEDLMDDVRQDDAATLVAEAGGDLDLIASHRKPKNLEDLPGSTKPGHGGSGNATHDERKDQEAPESVDLDRHSEVDDRETFPMPPGSPVLDTTGARDGEREVSDPEDEMQEEPETCYGDLGLETQHEADRMLSTVEPLRTQATEHAHRDEEKEKEHDHDEEDDDNLSEEDDDNLSQDESAAEKTQYLESQRLSTQHIRSMASRTAESDVFVSVHPSNVTNIVRGKKNHEMRAYALPHNVARIWLYETKPVTALQYMAEIGPAKKPGEITENTGLGNVEFNGKASTWRAYEILQVYQLADPKPLAELKENGWLKMAPTKTARVAPAVIDELMANLLPPLFPPEAALGAAAHPSSSSTDTQEIQEQLQSNVEQFTQPAQVPVPVPASTPHRIEDSESDDGMVVPRPRRRIPDSPVGARARGSSFPHARTPRSLAWFSSRRAAPSQATTVDLTQTQTQDPTRTPPRSSSQAEVEVEVVWESPARPVPSSTPGRLLPPLRGVGDDDHEQQEGPESLVVPFSMASSQLLTRSQMLSDSLLLDHGRGPPPLVVDSDDDDGDDGDEIVDSDSDEV